MVKPRGFSLVELMVVIAIISLLVTLTFPAVNSARESARKISCQNNQRQLGLAIQMHLNTHQAFPSNGGFLESSHIQSTTNQETTIWTNDFDAGTTFNWGIGVPGATPEIQGGSWAYAILPYIDQVNAYQQMKIENRQPMYMCPSRGRRSVAPPINDEYGEYQSGGWAWAKTDYCGNSRMMPNLPFILQGQSVSDGMSNTFIIGEKAYDPSVQTPMSWYWDEPIFSGGSKGTARAGLTIVPDGPGIAYKENWGSAHRGGAIFATADGSVRFISETIAFEVLRAMLTPSGGEYEHISD